MVLSRRCCRSVCRSFLVYLTLCRRRIGEGLVHLVENSVLGVRCEQGSQITQVPSGTSMRLGRSISARITIAAAFSGLVIGPLLYSPVGAIIGVSTSGMWMVVKVIPSARVSEAATSEKPSRAALLAT